MLGDIKKKSPNPTHQARDASLRHQGLIVVGTSEAVTVICTSEGLNLSATLQKGVTSLDTLTIWRRNLFSIFSTPCI
jgi:hypothetical protein